MAEATTPQAGVPEAAPSIENRLQNYFDREAEAPAEAEPEQAPPTAAPTAEAPAPAVEATPTDELAPEDLPDAETPTQPNAADEFEIVHNGTQHRLPRAEVIKLAQQGFDYTQKTQAVAERSKVIDSVMARVSEMEQILPVVAQEQAVVAGFKAQLAQYEKVDWVQLATDNPLEYPKYRAQYDLLINGHNQAAQRVAQAMGEYQQRRDEAQKTNLATQFQKLQELVPEWRDQTKFKSGTAEVHSYLLAQGADPQLLANLSDALSVSIARKAMLYDKAMKSKGEKSKLLQTVPPVARPGVANTAQSAQADKKQELARRFKKSGTVEDAAALYLQIMK